MKLTENLQFLPAHTRRRMALHTRRDANRCTQFAVAAFVVSVVPFVTGMPLLALYGGLVSFGLTLGFLTNAIRLSMRADKIQK